MKLDQDLCLNLWSEIHRWVRCAFGNVYIPPRSSREELLSGIDYLSTKQLSIIPRFPCTVFYHVQLLTIFESTMGEATTLPGSCSLIGCQLGLTRVRSKQADAQSGIAPQACCSRYFLVHSHTLWFLTICLSVYTHASLNESHKSKVCTGHSTWTGDLMLRLLTLWSGISD